MPNAPLTFKVGFLGAPNSSNDWMYTIPVDWSAENLDRLKQLGFNTIQLNVAWGSRPGDEPLNLEDVVELTPAQQMRFPQEVPLRGRPGPAAFAARRAMMQQRLELCQAAGLRTIFHFGAPYNAHARYGDAPPNCLLDPAVTERYELLLETFAAEFPGVDDILVYTYDQDAWLCDEFGPCPRCQGVPLHDRLLPFLHRLSATWQKISPQGWMWWEPWELSAGQVLTCVEKLKPAGLGLALHSNIAEVQATIVADRWLQNTCQLAAEREIPVIVEYWLGANSEELEFFSSCHHPLVTLRGLQRIHRLAGVAGIKEYFGLVPDREDPNLRMTALFFQDPYIAEAEALRRLAEIYGPAAAEMPAFWKLTSTAMELFPWDTSWFIREIGRSEPAHSLQAACLRGQQAHTPSWESTRKAIFMKTDDTQPDPWMLEDVQLRCELAAERWSEAHVLGEFTLRQIPAALRAGFQNTLTNLAGLSRSARAYACHLRETNLVTVLRRQKAEGHAYAPRVLKELAQVLADDLDNVTDIKPWPEMESAIALFHQNVDAFLATYFGVSPNTRSKGAFSVTSR